MILRNSSIMYGKTRITSRYKIAETSFDLHRGLMFNDTTPILFVFPHEEIWPIHSFFVLFEFDALYLDEEFRLVEHIKNIKPFCLKITNSKSAKYLLEIPKFKGKIKIGGKLELR